VSDERILIGETPMKATETVALPKTLVLEIPMFSGSVIIKGEREESVLPVRSAN
jgi:hypothetical protein